MFLFNFVIKTKLFFNKTASIENKCPNAMNQLDAIGCNTEKCILIEIYSSN